MGLSPSLSLDDLECFEHHVLEFRTFVNDRYAWVPCVA